MYKAECNHWDLIKEAYLISEVLNRSALLGMHVQILCIPHCTFVSLCKVCSVLHMYYFLSLTVGNALLVNSEELDNFKTLRKEMQESKLELDLSAY